MNGEFLMFVGDILIGIGIGIFLMSVFVYVMAKRFERRLRNGLDEMLSKVEDKTIGLIVEKHNNTIFCFSEEDKQFICQGANLAEIQQAFRTRFPDKVAYLAGGDPDVVELLTAQKEAEPIKESI